MKKLLLLFLTVALSLSCFISCSYLGGNSSQNEDNKQIFFVSPEDEEEAVLTVTQTNEDGLKLEITLHGYKSESLGKEFYVKNNAYFLADVKLTNESNTPVYQFLPTACRDMSPAHNHEISFDLANGDNKLHSSSFGFTCPETTETWIIEPGKSYEWQLKLAAGAPQSGTINHYPIGGVSTGENKEEGKDSFATENDVQEKKSVSDGYIYYDSNIISGGNFQVYESTYITNIYGSDFNFGTLGSLYTSYHFVNGSAVTIVGMLPSDGDESQMLRLYDNSIYTDNICTFDGTLSFAYMKSSDGQENTLSVSAPLSIEVVYVSNGAANIVVWK